MSRNILPQISDLGEKMYLARSGIPSLIPVAEHPRIKPNALSPLFNYPCDKLKLLRMSDIKLDWQTKFYK
jgi:hypothetical protein